MDVSLGVALEAAQARIALVDAVGPHTVVDQSRIELSTDRPDEGIATVASTLIDTERMLTQAGHRLATIAIESHDAGLAASLVQTLREAGVSDVREISSSDAVTAAVRMLSGADTAASLLAQGDTVALSIVDSAADVTSVIAVENVVDGDRFGAYRSLLGRFGEETGGATSVVVFDTLDNQHASALSTMSPVPLQFIDDSPFALARGSALAGLRPIAAASPRPGLPADPWSGEGAYPGSEDTHLAYSQVDDSGGLAWAAEDIPQQTPMQPLSVDAAADYETEEVEEPDTGRVRQPRTLLIGSTVAAVVVVGFAVLAVSVAINIRPESDRQTVRTAEETVTGKYFPPAPGQGVEPDGPAWAMIEQVPPPGIEPDARIFETKTRGALPGGRDSGVQLVTLWRDGTVGLQSAAAPFTPAIPTVPIVGTAGGISDGMALFTRLIPDFSRWSPCQVLALVANLRLAGEAMADIAEARSTGISLQDLGRIVVVPANQGTLFPVTNDRQFGTNTTAIPEELFGDDVTQSVSDQLPVGTKIVSVEALETAAGPDGAPGSSSPGSILEQILEPETVEALPGIAGTAPPVEDPASGGAEDPSRETPGPGSEVPGTDEAGGREDSPRDASDGGETNIAPDETIRTDGEVPAPADSAPNGEKPAAPGESGSEQRVPGESGETLPADGKPEAPDVPAPQDESPAADVPAPVVQEPAPRVEIPEPVVEAPAPVVEAPAPVVEAPAPVVEAPPPPPPSAPAPVVEAPAPAPSVTTPEVESAPRVETPTTTVTEVPELPTGGGLGSEDE